MMNMDAVILILMAAAAMSYACLPSQSRIDAWKLLAISFVAGLYFYKVVIL